MCHLFYVNVNICLYRLNYLFNKYAVHVSNITRLYISQLYLLKKHNAFGQTTHPKVVFPLALSKKIEWPTQQWFLTERSVPRNRFSLEQSQLTFPTLKASWKTIYLTKNRTRIVFYWTCCSKGNIFAHKGVFYYEAQNLGLYDKNEICEKDLWTLYLHRC